MHCVVYGINTDYLFDVIDSLDRLGWEVSAYVCNLDQVDSMPDVSPLVFRTDLDSKLLALPVIFPLITPSFRLKLRSEAMALGFSKFANIIDPTSIVSPRAELGPEGILVNAGSIIGPNVTLANFTVVNRGVSIGHNSKIEEFVTLGPSSVCCGSVHVGAGAFVGAGAVILPKVRIGENALVGAGAVVTRDVPSHCQVVGNPARICKLRVPATMRHLPCE